MNYIVFLLLSFFTIPTIDAATYDFSYYQIETELIGEGHTIGYRITKTGEQPFVIEISDEDVVYTITECEMLEEYIMIYGYSHFDAGHTYYDGFLWILTMEGDILYKGIYEYGQEEEVRDVFLIQDTVMISLEQSVPTDDQMVWNNHYIIGLDSSFNKLGEIEIPFQVRHLDETEDMLLVFEGYTNSVFLGITSEMIRINDDTPLNVIDGANYTDTISLQYIGDAFINGVKYPNGVTLAYPGYYQIQFQSEVYAITVDPKITGVEEGKTYQEEINPYISAGNIILNNDIFISGTTISKPGNYTLTVTGVNGYYKDIHFTITSQLDGIINEQEYDDPVTISFQGEGYLNNQYIQSPYMITDSGEYVLKLRGENSYLETYTFQINEEKASFSMIDFVKQFDILFFVVVVSSGALLLKKLSDASWPNYGIMLYEVIVCLHHSILRPIIQ